MTSVGIVTINEHEYAAVKNWLRGAGFQRVNPTNNGPFGSEVSAWNGAGQSVRLLYTGSSGNLVMALCVQSVFVEAVPLDGYVLFGCAARIPIEDAPEIGDVVVVSEAVYVENGVVDSETLSKKRTHEVVLVKLDHIEKRVGNGRLASMVARGCKLRMVKAFCSDKVIDFDPTGSYRQPKIADAVKVPYHKVITSMSLSVIDMETFGFFAAIGTDRVDRAVALRVVTDDGSSHHETTNSPNTGPPPQAALLEENAEILGMVLTLVAEGASKLQESLPHVGEASVAALGAASAALDKGIRGTRSLAARDLALNLQEALRTSDAGFAESDAELLRVGLDVFHRFGYCDESVSELLKLQASELQASEDEDVTSGSHVLLRLANILAPSRAPVTSAKAFVERYFPNDMKEFDIREFERGYLSWVVRIAVQDRDCLVAVGREDKAGRPEDSILWSGYRSDRELVVAVKNVLGNDATPRLRD